MSTAVKFSFEQYEMMVDAGIFAGKNQRRIELIRGELREMTPIGTRHATTVDRLTRWTTRFLDEDQVWLRIQGPVALPELESEPEPDVQWLAAKDYSKQHPRAGDVLLIIEVAEDSLRYDLGEKAALYAEAGITDYWVIDVASRRIHIHRQPEGDRYIDVQIVETNTEAHPLAFPELALRPKDVC